METVATASNENSETDLDIAIKCMALEGKCVLCFHLKRQYR